MEERDGMPWELKQEDLAITAALDAELDRQEGNGQVESEVTASPRTPSWENERPVPGGERRLVCLGAVTG